ncbi:hypothetical protein AMJ87_01430 [candidate division WOR_3 bacterium SM23_60]|uniref:DUF2905 domain-containing protein n=1 Tax=candidate division WOR_3 bacterium SM23_60 TaxID=1703780 RepID=A0A0S8GKN6_UNCW3|nr:MAG: hypothetical protein AMJ87_01430 [candidate division WOR_3 bacterium SM23_60]
MQSIARFFIIFGVIFVLVGTILLLFPKVPLGRLPGDIVIKNKHWVFVFPIVTSIIVSLVLTFILNLLLKK